MPFIVAGGQVDTTPTPLESVPVGRTTSTIYGLNVRYDYCFTVAAVWSADVIAQYSGLYPPVIDPELQIGSVDHIDRLR